MTDIKKSVEVTGNTPKEGEFKPDKNNTVLRESVDKDGISTLTSSINEDTAAKDTKLQNFGPHQQNQTQILHSVPGNTDLTAGGTLQGDKSLKQEQTLDELTQESEIVSGPNPIPNREGNEITKAGNVLSAGGPSLMFQIDATTNVMADKLKKIREKESLNSDDKHELEVMEKSLRQTGKV